MVPVALFLPFLFAFADIMKIWLLSALMGCDASKSTDVIENEEIESDTFDFTDTQIDTIRSTWPILACDMVDIGSKVFLKIFIDEPKLKYAFPSFRYFDYIYIFWYIFFYLLRINIGSFQRKVTWSYLLLLTHTYM